MINAGLEVLGFDGSQTFNATSEQWEGIKVLIHYPIDQDEAANPPATGDIVIEPSGSAWMVGGAVAESEGGGNYRFTLTRLFGPTTEEDPPQFGQVQRGAIVTPEKGVIVPYWNSTVVAAEVARYASTLTARLNVKDNTSDVNKPVSQDQQAVLDEKVDTVTAEERYAKNSELGNLANRNVTVSMDNPTGGQHNDLWLKIN